MATKLKVGVLALQGAVNEHINSLQQLNCQPLTVKKIKDLQDIDGLIIPGGESTTIGKLLREYGMIEAIKDRVQSGMGIFGTCAGLVLLAEEVSGNSQPLLKLMDIEAERNAFGAQIHSFETVIDIPEIGSNPFKAVFIRAPLILNYGKDVEIMGTYNKQKVLARQGNLLVSAFHPELTADVRLHQYFLKLLKS